MRTVADIVQALPSPHAPELPTPEYTRSDCDTNARVGLAVESMRRHMTDEGWQLFQGLEHAGYTLCGYAINDGETDVKRLLARYNSGTYIVQDKREWEGLTADRSRDPKMRFCNVERFKTRPDVFCVTVLKDAQNNPSYHSQSASEMGCHAWIVYYNTRIVKHVAPYVRERHLIRTWHTIDRNLVPRLTKEDRNGALLSGAVSVAYPLRQRLFAHWKEMKGVLAMKHPGYHRRGCQTPEFLARLCRHKAAICTSSVYGYALRKIVEATACGCRVVTDLPVDEVLPSIDRNLVRVDSNASVAEVNQALVRIYDEWDWQEQQRLALLAQEFYDYRTEGMRLAEAVERLRRFYS